MNKNNTICYAHGYSGYDHLLPSGEHTNVNPAEMSRSAVARVVRAFAKRNPVPKQCAGAPVWVAGYGPYWSDGSMV